MACVQRRLTIEVAIGLPLLAPAVVRFTLPGMSGHRLSASDRSPPRSSVGPLHPPALWNTGPVTKRVRTGPMFHRTG